MTDVTNTLRAHWAELSLQRFIELTGCDREDSLGDLLCNLMHWAKLNAFDFGLALERARGHFEAELLEESASPAAPPSLDLQGYGENVAAISAMVHGDPDTYQRIYDKLGDQVGGFVGIWDLCASAAEAFSIEEAPYTAGEDFYWIEAIEHFGERIVGYLEAGECPSVADMHRLAAGAIESNFIGR